MCIQVAALEHALSHRVALIEVQLTDQLELLIICCIVCSAALLLLCIVTSLHIALVKSQAVCITGTVSLTCYLLLYQCYVATMILHPNRVRLVQAKHS
jgi:hypothetical protein